MAAFFKGSTVRTIPEVNTVISKAGRPEDGTGSYFTLYLVFERVASAKPQKHCVAASEGGNQPLKESLNPDVAENQLATRDKQLT